MARAKINGTLKINGGGIAPANQGIVLLQKVRATSQVKQGLRATSQVQQALTAKSQLRQQLEAV